MYQQNICFVLLYICKILIKMVQLFAILERNRKIEIRGSLNEVGN